MSADIEGFAEYLYEEELAAATIASYTIAVKQFFNQYDELNKANLIDWKKNLLQTKKTKTVNLRITALQKYSKFKGNKIEIKRVHEQKITSVENVITEEQYHKLIVCLERDGKQLIANRVKIAAKTGARIGELLQLKKKHLDKGYADLPTKGKYRRIYIPQSLTEEVGDFYRDYTPNEYLFQRHNGKQITSRGFAQNLHMAARKYGIPQPVMHPHSFRHFFAIQFLKNKNDIALLADVMGHSGVNTTMIYLRKSQQQQMSEISQAVKW